MKTPEVVNDFVLAVVCGELRKFRGRPLDPETVGQMMETIMECTGVLPNRDPVENILADDLGRSLKAAIENVNKQSGNRPEDSPQGAGETQ